mgnify:CR=1 FL=1
MNLSEQWKPVLGFEGYYEVSDLGRVRSLDRTIVNSLGRVCRVRGQLLSACKNRKGYFKVSLFRNNRETTSEVHRLVAEAFHGPCPPNHETRHLDGVRDNNCASNLRYGTAKQNQHDRRAHGTSMQGESHQGSKLTDDQLTQVRDTYLRGEHTMRQVGELFGVGATTVFRVVSGKRQDTYGNRVACIPTFSRSGQR